MYAINQYVVPIWEILGKYFRLVSRLEYTAQIHDFKNEKKFILND